MPDHSSYTGSADDGIGDPHVGYAPYDFASIMHYGGGSEYDTNPPEGEHSTGNRRHLVQGDIDQLNDMYQCKLRNTPPPTPAPPTSPPSPTALPTALPTRRPTRNPTAGPTHPPTPAPPAGSFADCTFDQTTCGWSNGADSTLQWTRTTGGTPSSGTGPSGDHTNGVDGYYMFTESSSPNYPQKAFRLESPRFSISSDATLSFWYHMAGSGMGRLEVHTNTGSGGVWEESWHKSGPQGASWQLASLQVPAVATIVQFRGITGADYKSDMAIDDISLQEG